MGERGRCGERAWGRLFAEPRVGAAFGRRSLQAAGGARAAVRREDGRRDRPAQTRSVGGERAAGAVSGAEEDGQEALGGWALGRDLGGAGGILGRVLGGVGPGARTLGRWAVGGWTRGGGASWRRTGGVATGWAGP